MTMISPAHPDPERLAALAGQDPDAAADLALTEHVASCAACGPQVRELAALRAALAELPDLTPSRPLQLVPPVPPAPVASGWRVAFRRAFAPVAVGGMVLILIGGVGATGALGPADAQRLFFVPYQAVSGGAPTEGQVDEGAQPEVTSTDGGLAPAATMPADNGGSAAGEDDPGTSRGEEEPGTPPAAQDLDATTTVSGWVVLVIAGLALLVLAFLLRITGPPRSTAGR